MSQQVTKKEEVKVNAVSTWREFDDKVLEIHRLYDEIDDPSIEVTNSFFQSLSKGAKTKYLTYGKPGIKVYIEGTIDQIKHDEALSAEEFHELQIREAKEDLRLKKEQKRK